MARQIRAAVSDEEWAEVLRLAEERGETPAEAVGSALRLWIAGEPPGGSPTPSEIEAESERLRARIVEMEAAAARTAKAPRPPAPTRLGRTCPTKDCTAYVVPPAYCVGCGSYIKA